MRLGFILEPEANNSNYRVLIPMRELERRGHEILWPPTPVADVPLARLAGCDLVHCFRRPDRIGDLEQLSRRGVAISYDNDDDFTTTDVGVKNGKLISGLEGRRHNAAKGAAITRAIRLADLTTTPSPVLAERYRAVGAKHVATLDNHLESGALGLARRAKHQGTVIAWVAALEHSADLPRLEIVAPLEYLLTEHRELHVASVGVRLPIRSERYVHIPRLDPDELLRFVGGVDIGIAPLADTAFNRGRSSVKLKEYATGGAAWVASPVGPYAGLGSSQGGVLAADDGWLTTLDGLIRGGFARRRLVRRALKWARSETIDRFGSDWEMEFQRAILRAQSRMRSA